MPVGIEGLALTLQRADSAQSLQTVQQNLDRGQQVAAGVLSQELGRQRDSQVDDRPPVNQDGLWSDQQGGEPGAERHGRTAEEDAPPEPAPPVSPDGRGARIDLKA